jgi:cyclase
MRRLLLLITLVTAATAHAGPERVSEIQIVPTELGNGLYMLEGRGGNLGVSVGDDGVFLIDDQYAPLTPKIRAAIALLSDKPIRFVLNTHWHGDHTGGNENLGKAGALIVAHDKVRERMSVDSFMEAFNSEVKASPRAALPVVTFSDTVTFHLNGQTLHAFHVAPAHTDGDSVVHFREADVIHAGDLVFMSGYPVIDFGSGGHIDGMIAAVDRLLAMADADTKIIPGHGKLTDRAGLTEYRTLLVTVRDRIAKLIKQGKSEEQIVAAKPTADFDAKWGNGFYKPDNWVALVHKGMLRNGGYGKKR